MNAPLRDLLSELAEEQPPVGVAPDLYRKGRRAHRRTTALKAGAVTGLVAVALVAAGPVLDRAEVPPVPAASDAAPAMPAQLYAVPEWLVSFDEEGYTWHDDLRVDGLALGTTAAVLPVDGGAVVAVSAVDGEYRGLELPGFDERSYFAFEDTPVALSPDGNRLAWTWNSDVDGFGGTTVESGVRVADLGTGEVTDVAIPSRLGVATHGFGWSPDGRYLAYGLRVVTASDEDTYATGRHRVERLDTTTWERVRTPLPDMDTAPAVSNHGAVAVSGAGYNGIWTPGAPRVQRFQGPYDSVAWAPVGRRLALTSTTATLATADPDGVSRETSWNADRQGRLRVLGWPDDSGFVVLDEATSTFELVTADLEDSWTLVEVGRMPDLLQLSVATDLLDEPTRNTPPPEWPSRWLTTLLNGLAAVVLLAGVGLVLLLSRRL